MSQKIYRNTVAGVIEALQLIFDQGLYADKAIPQILKQNNKWGSRDRKFVAEHSYNLVRWWKRYWAILDESPSVSKPDLYRLFGIYWLYLERTLPPWDEFETIKDFQVDVEKLNSLAHHQKASYPEWLDQRAHSELGDKWIAISDYLNFTAPFTIRTNTLKTSREILRQKLRAEGVETKEYSGNDYGLIIEKRFNLTNFNLYNSGLFEVQDAGSQEISNFLDPKEGDFIIDACAGAGGKSLDIGARMKNIGSILSMDIEGYKLKELENRTKRNRVKIIKTKRITSVQVIKQYAGKADKLLLDVPCSGTGVIKRQPDTKWKLSESRLEEFIGIQKEILSDYSTMVKPGGTLVYATCSVLKSENEDQVKWFLGDHQEYKLIKEKRIDPSEFTDGFYMASFIKS